MHPRSTQNGVAGRSHRSHRHPIWQRLRTVSPRGVAPCGRRLTCTVCPLQMGGAVPGLDMQHSEASADQVQWLTGQRCSSALPATGCHTPGPQMPRPRSAPVAPTAAPTMPACPPLDWAPSHPPVPAPPAPAGSGRLPGARAVDSRQGRPGPGQHLHVDLRRPGRCRWEGTPGSTDVHTHPLLHGLAATLVCHSPVPPPPPPTLSHPHAFSLFLLRLQSRVRRRPPPPSTRTWPSRKSCSRRRRRRSS